MSLIWILKILTVISGFYVAWIQPFSSFGENMAAILILSFTLVSLQNILYSRNVKN